VRWVTFTSRGSETERVGLVDKDRVVEFPRPVSLLDLIKLGAADMREQGEAALAKSEREHRLDEITLRAPVPSPPSVRDFMAFEQHVAAGARRRGEQIPKEWYEMPVFYFSNPHALVGPYDPVPMPPGCGRLDFELEVAVVIGRAGQNVQVEDARAHIAGFMILNDWSARDLQQAESRVVGPGPSKSKDSATTTGPMLVTVDELEESWTGSHPDLELKVSVNGREYGRDLLTNMYWTFEELIAHASRGTWVRPGDIIASGTCGYGCLAELRAVRGEDQHPWLAAGDEVTVEVTGLGRISNRIIDGPAVVPLRSQ
jgi:2-keto-4-pentenoate hydratase/2-oxohepta-3-ene-1,7-dioic acid hydratase in catechol pathway